MSRRDQSPGPLGEGRDADPRLVAALAGSLAFLVALGLFAGFLAIGRTGPAAEAAFRGSDELFQHGAEAKTDIATSWEDIDRRPAPPANGYAWIDRDKGVVSVPIDRAIDLVCAEQGADRQAGDPQPSSR